MNIQNRYDFAYLFDVINGNPNGDPDAGNLPRIDAETGQGLITDVCLKRKVRNFVTLVKKTQSPYDIYIKEKAILNQVHQKAYDAIEDENGSSDKEERARQWMCQNFYDVRTFGAVMSTKINCGQVRGPVQLTFSRSYHQIFSQEHSITRMAATNEQEAKEQEKQSESGANRTMGRKYTVPYGLYVGYGFISAHLAEQTGFNQEDLDLFWQALENMFEHDRSAARGQMTARGLYVFKHDSALGNAPAHSLFDLIQVSLKDEGKPVREFSDYAIKIDENEIPTNVTLERRIG